MRPPSLYALCVLTLMSSGGTYAQSPDSYLDGVNDRSQYESWFAQLTADYKKGVEFWVGNRSKPMQASCFGQGAAPESDWMRGCLTAQRRFAPLDAKRKSDPEYRLGWNSIQSVEVQQAARARRIEAANAATIPFPGNVSAPEGAKVHAERALDLAGMSVLYKHRDEMIIVVHGKATPGKLTTCSLMIEPPKARWAAFSVQVDAKDAMTLFITDTEMNPSWIVAERRPLNVGLETSNNLMIFTFESTGAKPLNELIAALPRAAAPGVLSALEDSTGLTLSIKGQKISYSIPREAVRTFRTCTHSLMRDRLDRSISELQDLVR